MELKSLFFFILAGFTSGQSGKALADIGLFNTESNQILILCSRDNILITKHCASLPLSMTCSDSACTKGPWDQDLSEFTSSLATDTGPYEPTPDGLERLEYAISITDAEAESYSKLLGWKSNLESWLEIIGHLEESYVGPALTQIDSHYSKLLAGISYHDEISNWAFSYSGVHTYEGARRACQALGKGWKLPDGSEAYKIMGSKIMGSKDKNWESSIRETALGKNLERMLRREQVSPSKLINTRHHSAPPMSDQAFFSDYFYTSQAGTKNCVYFYKTEGIPSRSDLEIYLRTEVTTNCDVLKAHTICMLN